MGLMQHMFLGTATSIFRNSSNILGNLSVPGNWAHNHTMIGLADANLRKFSFKLAPVEHHVLQISANTETATESINLSQYLGGIAKPTLDNDVEPGRTEAQFQHNAKSSEDSSHLVADRPTVEQSGNEIILHMKHPPKYVKPNNILVENGTLKVVDFANATMHALDADMEEICAKDPLSRVDILGLGCIIYSIAAWRVFYYDYFEHDCWPEPENLPAVAGCVYPNAEYILNRLDASCFEGIVCPYEGKEVGGMAEREVVVSFVENIRRPADGVQTPVIVENGHQVLDAYYRLVVDGQAQIILIDVKSIALDEPYLANLFANELIHLPACLPLEQQSKELPFHPDRALLPDVVIIQPPIRIDLEALNHAYGKISMALHAHSPRMDFEG
ncbi:conserved hypothetical protein [Histoplasma capsulatum H143]|uniref:Protein kinase domain-containing protein n=1 Tax=Ajellomyces capsulatus (strain H143) TaxID=544712 RepID=C6HPH4_AJECH|nr:conserved hypothetical protein [Histoplasma capsulatum H143]